MNKTIDLARIVQDRFFSEDKNGPKHESRERRLLQTYENLREFADLVFTIQSKLYSLIEKHPIPTTPSTKDPIDVTTLTAHIQSEYDMLPKRYQQLIDDALVRFVNNRILSKMIYTNTLGGGYDINKILELNNVSTTFKRVELTPYGLCITLPESEMSKLLENGNMRGIKAGGLAMSMSIKFSNGMSRIIYVTFVKDYLPSYQREVFLRHEHEHILQFSQSVYTTPDNLSRILSSSDALSSDSIDASKLTKEKSTFDQWKSEIYSDPNILNNKKFLKELRANFFITVKREIFAYMTDYRNNLHSYVLKSYFTDAEGPYNLVTRFREEITSNGFTLNEAIWNEIMVAEYEKIIDKAIAAYFYLVYPNGSSGVTGISKEQASSFLGMYSLEDWSDYVRRYNTRGYAGSIIIAPLKIFEHVETSLEILRKLPWYNSMQRYLKNIEFIGNELVINKKQRVFFNPERASSYYKDLAFELAKVAYRIYCEEMKKTCDEDSFMRDLIHRIGTADDWESYQRKHPKHNPLYEI